MSIPILERMLEFPFIHLQDKALQTFRLSLVKAFQQVMANMLNLMGITPLERI